MRAAAWLWVACAFAVAPNAHGADNAKSEKSDKAIQLFEDATGTPLQFKDFFVNDGALQVSAAALAGVPQSAVNIAESVNDVAVFVQGLDSRNKGTGFAIAPARIRKPWPRIEVKDYLERETGALLLANLSLSYAQGNVEVESKKVIRRAVSVSTGGSLAEVNIWRTACAVCATSARSCAVMGTTRRRLDVA